MDGTNILSIFYSVINAMVNMRNNKYRWSISYHNKNGIILNLFIDMLNGISNFHYINIFY
jgi:hypothetical protein